MSRVELDFQTDSAYWQSEQGGQLKQFAHDLYAVMGQDDNISLYKAAGVLLFSNQSSGAESFIKWHQSGLLIIDQLRPPRIRRRQLVVAQLVKATIATQPQTFTSIHSAVRRDLMGSGLEQHVAPNPRLINRTATVSLEFPDEPWFYDLAPRTRSRSWMIKQ